jgi:hypothetical protein
MFILFYQPILHGTNEYQGYNKKPLLFANYKLKRTNFFSANYLNLEINLYHQFTYGLFIGCCMYAASFLPYGRFYNRLGGNIGMLGSYMYIFIYLGFPILRRPIFLELFSYFLYNRINFLKN